MRFYFEEEPITKQEARKILGDDPSLSKVKPYTYLFVEGEWEE